MTAEQFAYWFQGLAELSETPPTQAQWDSMREHVATVFKKVTPEFAPVVINNSGFAKLSSEQCRQIEESLLLKRHPTITC